MISIKKDFDTPPEKLVQSKRNEHIKDALVTKNEHKFKSSIYRKTTIDALETLYNFKCAYCESDTSAGAPFQVEHFRPKAKTEGDATHKGYYWLAYEWSNLTLGCSACNNAKKNHFPIKGNRISEPILDATGFPLVTYLSIDSDELKGEQAVLLNPEVDVVENHFYFTPDGKIVGVDDRGKTTIEKLKLNRKRLVFWRKKLLDDYLKSIKNILEDFLTKQRDIDQCRYAIKLEFEKITLQQNPEKQYSRFGFFMFSKFEIFFANQLEKKQKEAVLKFFELFKQGEL
ncbi:hypothetical protein EMA8858_02673 [Emticicia aquatica]|uniref:HNH domain-containing protein n=1 Tax=Emticicia aquatica TaxID=1681835 RepID=A0ABN8EV29_9BACT|nr:HNH endonuclease [Emticicia aquatica]CAH0996541.1 hypothetical protein EMA8858_02673 [Emticicia aquatica]